MPCAHLPGMRRRVPLGRLRPSTRVLREARFRLTTDRRSKRSPPTPRLFSSLDKLPTITNSYWIKLLRQKREKPFFIGVGLRRPHAAWIAPRKYFDLYPLGKLSLPAPGSRKQVPPVAFTNREPNYGVPDEMLHFLQGYLATVTFVDAQVGRLLDELDRLRLTDDTIVVLFGDHGFHLGEHGLWHKHTLFEESCRTPLIIAAPGMAADKRCPRTVELLDLFPTLADLCAIQPPTGLEGVSLRPLLADPHADWDRPACTVRRSNWNGQPVIGRTIRTEHWRYTEWDGGREGRELYDHVNDPLEYRNVAKDPQLERVVREMSERLAGLIGEE